MISGMRVRRRSSAVGGRRAYQHYRLDILSNNGSATINIAQWELLAGPGGPNLALIPPLAASNASASSTFPGGATYGPRRAFNDTPTEFWSTANNQTSGWIAIDLQQPEKVQRYTIRARAEASPSGFVDGAPNTWHLQGSDDGVEWVTLDSREGEDQWTGGEVREYRL